MISNSFSDSVIDPSLLEALSHTCHLHPSFLRVKSSTPNHFAATDGRKALVECLSGSVFTRGTRQDLAIPAATIESRKSLCP